MNLMRLKNSVPLSDIKYAPRRGTLPSPGQNTLPALRVQDVVDLGKPLPPLLSGQDEREVVVQRPGAGVLLQEALVDEVVDLSLEGAPHVALPRAGWRKFLVRSKALRYLISQHCHYLVFGDIVTNLLPRHWGKNVGRHLGLNGGLHTAITVTVTNDPEHADHGLIKSLTSLLCLG